MDQFEKLYLEYYEDIRIFLLCLTGYQKELADELTQETFYQAILSFHRFRGDSGIKTWLCQIAKNLYHNSLRSQRKVQVPFNEEISESEALHGEMESNLAEKELLFCSVKIINGFDKKTRDVMICRIFFDIPYCKISKKYNISESSAKVIYMRGKQKLQKILREGYGYEI